jgi:hypothetical protein
MTYWQLCNRFPFTILIKATVFLVFLPTLYDSRRSSGEHYVLPRRITLLAHIQFELMRARVFPLDATRLRVRLLLTLTFVIRDILKAIWNSIKTFFDLASHFDTRVFEQPSSGAHLFEVILS